ncbi:MAG: Sulfite dehydrogenase (quinone), membrane-anchor subunit SoeC [Rhodanobacteraceae bacterium]|jgi:DMSO reductase anchor subunit|nr:MAG: Sulfite dehydrogenase (quinone), membrane-anchor subunit SoeC [Rhodanobacteraceae bacterium]
MKPALSVIFFTVLSGAGYGLWCWLGAALAAGVYPHAGTDVLAPLVFGFALVTAGLLASTSHLGRPERAWRALTQWKSSWLSREGIASLVTYMPMLALAWLAMARDTGASIRVAGALLALCALATIFCTANIYRSLKTIRAWRAPQVLPLYFLFALLSGGLWLWSWLLFTSNSASGAAFPLALLALAVIAAIVKVDYWRGIDAQPANTAGHATGLETLGMVRAFEGPATEESYLTREMAFVLARKHAARLRRSALMLFAALPILGLVIAMFVRTPWIAPIVAIACVAGLFIERWLFFAEARHAVAAFFPARRG